MGIAADYMREFNAYMDPIRDAIDAAMRSNKMDAEALLEDVESHVQWWIDELWAEAHADD